MLINRMKLDQNLENIVPDAHSFLSYPFESFKDFVYVCLNLAFASLYFSSFSTSSSRSSIDFSFQFSFEHCSYCLELKRLAFMERERHTRFIRTSQLTKGKALEITQRA